MCLHAWKNIEQMKTGLDRDYRNLIIYLDDNEAPPCLYKVQKRGNQIIKSYPEHNSADPAMFQTVIKDIINFAPSDSYGLVLWSHGTSWIPANAKLKSFGRDGKNEMDVKELANALPVHFDYILFDACILMGSVEVAYELKGKTNYIISSPTESLADGFPYEKITPLLFGGEHELIALATEYFNYYSRMKGQLNSASISVLNTDELDQLAYLTERLIKKIPLEKWDYHHKDIQALDMYENHISYDFFNFLHVNYSVQEVREIESQLKQVVIYKANTNLILGTLPVAHFCGIGCYVPIPGNTQMNNY